MSEDSTPRISVEYDGDTQRHIDVEYVGSVDYAVVEMPDSVSSESLVDDLAQVCRNNGGKLK